MLIRAMTKAEEYREKADEAHRSAEAARDLRAKETYRQIAAKWHEMAQQAERHNW
jgi:uncharacterized coiled-coil DUF342 family protein